MQITTPPDPSIGERIKHHRRRAGISQRALAERIGLTGRPVTTDPARGLRYDALAKIRKALTQYDDIADMLDPTGLRRAERPPDLRWIRRATIEANRLYQASKYLAVGELLPGLIVQAHRAVRELDGADRRKAHGALAEVYHITAKTLSRVGEPGLAWIVAERARYEAHASEMPLLIAASAYHLGNAFLRADRFAESTSIVLTVAEAIGRNQREMTPERLSAAGGLHLVAVINAARAHDHSAARQLLRKAAGLGREVDDGRNDLWLAFGAANVSIHGVAAAIELGAPIETIRRGESIDLAEIPPELRGRRSQVLIDLARGYAHRRMDAAAVNALLEAEQLAPEAVQFSDAVHQMIDQLLRREHRASTPQLRSLARRLRVVD